MSRILPLFILLTLAGCMSKEERVAKQEAADDQQCLSYGAKQGSDAYVACRTNLATNRATNRAIINSSGEACSRFGTTTVCN
jgi:hypothetical protein